MLVEMHKRSIIPDLILFADTGGERHETYRTVWLVSEWCKLKGLPQIVTVSNQGQRSNKTASRGKHFRQSPTDSSPALTDGSNARKNATSKRG